MFDIYVNYTITEVITNYVYDLTDYNYYIDSISDKMSD